MERKFHSSKVWLFFSFFLLLLFLSPFSFASLLDGAVQNNTALAPSLWHFTENYAGAPENSPSMSDPVIFAQAKIFTAIPQVGVRVNSAENTSVLFGWGEAHAEEASESVPNENCPPTVITVAAQPVYADLAAEFSFFGENRSVEVESALVSMPFSQSELERELIEKEGNGTIENEMLVELYGTVNFPYEKTTQGYAYVCMQNCQGQGNCTSSCSCEYFSNTEQAIFIREVYDNASFEVEADYFRHFVSKPALLVNVKGKNPLEILVFSREGMQNVVLLKGNEMQMNRTMHGFFAWEDEFGVAHVEVGNESSESEVMHENYFLCPVQLIGGNLTFSHLYEIKKKMEFERGVNEIALKMENDFGRERDIAFAVQTKEKTALIVSDGEEGVNGNYETILVDDEGQEIEGKDLEVSESGGAFSARFEGDEEYFPSAGGGVENEMIGIGEVGVLGSVFLAAALAFAFFALRKMH